MMAKLTLNGPAKPDDPIYTSGPVVGGKRIGRSSKTGEGGSRKPPKPSPKMPMQDVAEAMDETLQEIASQKRDDASVKKPPPDKIVKDK
jgi:hypothetical protein